MGRGDVELQRTDSICPSPEVELLEAVRLNNIAKIKSLISENPSLINTIVGHPFDKPILQIACNEFADHVISETVETLVDLGADLYLSQELHNHKVAVHFATLGLNPAILRSIIKRIRPDQIDEMCAGNTALNLLIKEGDHQHENFSRCAGILIQAGIDVNKADNKNLTPVFWAAKKGYKEIVEKILIESKTDVDLDGHKLRGKSARDLIIENFKDLAVPMTANNNKEASPDLFGLIKEYNEEAFVNLKNLDALADSDDGTMTLLQAATKKGLTRIVRCLLSNDADPNKTTKKTPYLPVTIAASEGFHAILTLFLNDQQTTIPSTLLNNILQHMKNDEDVTHEDVNYNLCYKLVMKHKNHLNVNIPDKNRKTPLHYAARYGGTEKTLDLLRAGASMASKDNFGSLPIEDIDATILEKHLDECLQVHVEGNIDKENLMGIFNYKTLMPPASPTFNGKTYDAEAGNTLIASEIEQLASETQVITYISKSPELKHLLKHPVITSFLYIKWHRIRWFFYTNLAFYIAFCLSLIFYILLVCSKAQDDYKNGFYILSAILGVTFVILVLRELFQVAVSPKTYFKMPENYLEVVLIVLTSIILFHQSPSENLEKQVSAFAILVAAFELVILIGQHPKMSTNIVMLRTVSLNFFKFLLWYSILIIAFSLSFFTLFQNPSEADNSNSTEEEQDFFVDPGISLFKTIVMLTGEFDASSINFQLYPFASHLIFILFVFMIAIILFNLLNGLAVSDTQFIKSNAELVGHIARIEHIAYVESMLLGNILPRSILNCLQRYCCYLPKSVNRFNVTGILIKRVCLFPYFLKDYKMMIYPNQQAKVALTCGEYSDGESSNCIQKFSNIYLDKQTAKRTKQLIRAKKEVLEHERSEQITFTKQQKIIEHQQKCIEDLRKEQQIILNKLDYIITNMSFKV